MDMATCPRIYYADEMPFVMNWIAEGTDGNLYLVPAEPGGCGATATGATRTN